MALDLIRTADSFVATLDMPGMDPGSIDVDTEGKVLTVRAERTRPEGDEVRWLVRGRRYGQFVQRFPLGDSVNADAVTADYTNGVLTLIAPLAEKAMPRKIDVTSGGNTVAAAEVEQAA